MTQNIQITDAKIRCPREYFDIVLEPYPSLHERRELDSRIVYEPYFEPEFVKIKGNREESLTIHERKADNNRGVLQVDEESFHYAYCSSITERVSKRLKKDVEGQSLYINTTFLV